jgi:hypothetical protein
MKYLAIAFCFPLVFISCSKGDSGFHVPPKVMQKMLLDMNISEAYSLIVKDGAQRLPGKNMDSLAAYYKDILEHYHITAGQFSENLDWYKNHPEVIDTIYTNITPIIAGWQSKFFNFKPVYPKTMIPYYEKPQIPSLRASSNPNYFNFLNINDSASSAQ